MQELVQIIFVILANRDSLLEDIREMLTNAIISELENVTQTISYCIGAYLVEN